MSAPLGGAEKPSARCPGVEAGRRTGRLGPKRGIPCAGGPGRLETGSVYDTSRGATATACAGAL